MGLLDFFTKSGSQNPQTQSTTTPIPDFASIQQSYTNQSLANVSYPMANPSQYGAPAQSVQPIQPIPNQPQMQPMQIQVPQQQYANPQFVNATQTIPVVRDLMDINIPSVQPTKPDEEDLLDPSKHPVVPTVVPDQSITQNLPEGIEVTTLEPKNNSVPVEPLPHDSLQSNAFNVANQPSTVFEPMPVVAPIAEVVSEQEPVVGTVQDLQQQESLPELQSNLVQPVVQAKQPIEAPLEPTLEARNLQTDQGLGSVSPILPSVETVSPVSLVEPTVEEKKEEEPGSLEIGVSMPSEVVNSDATTNIESVEAPVENLIDTTVEIPQVETSNDAILPSVETPLPETESTIQEDVDAVESVDLQPSTDLVEESVDNIVNPIPVTNSLVENEPQNQTYAFTFFKSFAFIGLNTPQPNLKVAEKLTQLANLVSLDAELFLMDSAKGYAKSIFDSAKQNNVELTGMLLKPFHSGYSDESDLGEYENYTVMMFSSNIDKVKNIIKESDVLIMPEVSGLNNLGILFETWSTASLYPGQNKPIILLGKAWSNVLDQVKTIFKLSDSDLSLVHVCQSAEESVTILTELDKAYSLKQSKSNRKVIDLREEEDEEGLFV